MKKLEHPNLVRLFEVIDDDLAGRMFLVMEYVPVSIISLFGEQYTPNDNSCWSSLI